MTRIAIAGVGAWGINHVRVFATEPAAKLVALCDPDEGALARARTMAPNALAARHLDEVLDVCEAVVIATPARSHAALAIRALEAGKHVLVEKPLALDVPAALQVEAAARRAGRVVVVGHLMVYHPALAKLRALIREGELGAIRYLHATRVNLGRARSDENALWSFGPHDLSMIDYLLGVAPDAVAAHGAAYLQPNIQDVVFMTLRFAGDVLGHVHLSWLDPRKERRLTIVGAAKMAELDDMASDKLRIFDRGYDRPPDFTHYGEYLTIRHGGVQIPHLVLSEPLRNMARHFLSCCVGEATPETDVASGVRIVQILAAAQESLDGGGGFVRMVTT